MKSIKVYRPIFWHLIHFLETLSQIFPDVGTQVWCNSCKQRLHSHGPGLHPTTAIWQVCDHFSMPLCFIANVSYYEGRRWTLDELTSLISYTQPLTATDGHGRPQTATDGHILQACGLAESRVRPFHIHGTQEDGEKRLWGLNSNNL